MVSKNNGAPRMKLQFRIAFIACWFLLLGCAFRIHAQSSKLIHYWDFNSTLPCTGKGGVDLTPLSADFSLLGNARVVYDTIIAPLTCYCGTEIIPIIDNVSPGTTLNQQLGYAPDVTCPSTNNAVRIRNPAFGMQFVMYIPSTGFSNIKIKYATTASGSGPVEQFYNYSLDSGKTWTNANLSTQGVVVAVPQYLSGFDTVPTIDLSAIPGANNNPKLAFRITFGDTAYYYKNLGTSGNDRIDNITVCGDSSCPAFVVQPLNQTACPGSNVAIVATGGGLLPGFNLKWQQNKGTGWVNLTNTGVYSGVSTDTLKLTNVTYSMNGYQYRCELIPTTSCGKVYSRVITLTVHPNPAIQANANDNKSTVCSGQPLLLFGSGGAQYYTWSGGIVDNTTFTATASGTYTVTSTDVNGCTGTASIAITVNPSPVVTINEAPTTGICQGYQVTLTGQSTSPNLTYSWNSPAVTNAVPFTIDSSKTYIVVGTDSKGCTGTSSIPITVTAAPAFSAVATKLTVCQGDTITLKGIGNAQSYSWSGGATDRVPFTPAPTTYTVTATAVSGCTKTATVTINVNPLPAVAVTASATAVCENGSVTLSGKGALTYLWSGGITDGTPFIPSSSNTYTVTGTDANGCVSTSSAAITVHPLPILTTKASANPVCAGQSVTVAASGAATYKWSNGIGQDTAFTATASATYSVTGVDGYGCSANASLQLVVKPLPTITFSSSTLSICAGQAVTLYGHGGSTYAWSGGITNAKAFSPSSTTTYTLTGTNSSSCSNTTVAKVTVNPLPVVTASANPAAVCKGSSTSITAQGALNYTFSGTIQQGVSFTPSATSTYTITGTDSAGCIATAKVTVPVNPLPVPIVAAASDTICKGGAEVLTASGAKSYSWTGGISNGQPFVPNVGANYTLTVTDANGCTASSTVPVYVNPSPLVRANASLPSICSGGSLTLGGTGAFTYVWNNGVIDEVPFTPSSSATYVVVGTDAHGCTGKDSVYVPLNANPSATATATPATFCAGDSVLLSATGGVQYLWNPLASAKGYAKPNAPTTYTVVVTDTHGCTATATASVTGDPAPQINILATQTSVCPGGKLTILAMGASTYVWSDGAEQGNPFAPAKTGYYVVTATDSLGCTAKDSIHLTVKADPVISLKASKPIVCPGDTIKLEASGATIYTWSPATGLSATTGAEVVCKPSAQTTYTVTGSTLGCSSAGNYTIAVKVATPPKVVATANPPAPCEGQSVTLAGEGAKTYSWTGGVINGASFVPITSATYTLTGTDSNGCKATAVLHLPLGTVPVLAAKAFPAAICPGQSAQLSVNQASGYTYLWNTGDTTPVLNVHPLFPITYTVTVHNGNCSADTIIPLNVNPGVNVSINGPASICQGAAVVLQATGGATSFHWSPAIGLSDTLVANPTANPSVTTTYTLVAGNAGNCSGIDTFQLVVNSIPSAQVCCQTTIPVGQSANLHLSNLTPGAVVSWFPSADLSCATCTSVTASPKETTHYTITIADSTGGCSSKDTVSVTVEGGCIIFVPNAFSPNADGKNDDLKVMGACIEKMAFFIFDRWGNKVFETEEQSTAWDGTFRGNPMPAGGYVYYLSATTYEGIKMTRSGEINLIR